MIAVLSLDPGGRPHERQGRGRRGEGGPPLHSSSGPSLPRCCSPSAHAGGEDGRADGEGAGSADLLVSLRSSGARRPSGSWGCGHDHRSPPRGADRRVVAVLAEPGVRRVGPSGLVVAENAEEQCAAAEQKQSHSQARRGSERDGDHQPPPTTVVESGAVTEVDGPPHQEHPGGGRGDEERDEAGQPANRDGAGATRGASVSRRRGHALMVAHPIVTRSRTLPRADRAGLTCGFGHRTNHPENDRHRGLRPLGLRSTVATTSSSYSDVVLHR